MQFTLTREALMKPLQRVVGAAEKRQTMPILSNILVVVKNQLLSLTGTDLEIEMISRIPLVEPSTPGAVTIPAKKLMDICRALPEDAQLSFELTENKVLVRSKKSRYTLACLSAQNFPRVEESPSDVELSLPQAMLRQLLEFTSFAMAHQDVRYYLNGVCLVFSAQEVRLIATDGHRLATMVLPIRFHLTSPMSVIIPRKAVLEMQRLFAEGDEELGIVIGKNHLRTVTTHSSFITKLIEGKFPDYRNVVPSQEQGSYQMVVSREPLRQALLRVSALFSDRYRGVGLQFSTHLLKIVAVTSDKDEVEDEIEIHYEGPPLEIGLNASYLIEYLGIIKTDQVKASFTDPNHVVLFESVGESLPGQASQHSYVIMPMRL